MGLEDAENGTSTHFVRDVRILYTTYILVPGHVACHHESQVATLRSTGVHFSQADSLAGLPSLRLALITPVILSRSAMLCNQAYIPWDASSCI